jgi:hypothetical protein
MRRVALIAWSIAVFLSLAVGAGELTRLLAARPRAPFTARASSDAFLGARPGERPADALVAALGRLPADGALVLAGRPEDPRHVQVLYTVSLLALPRQVGGMRCRGGVPEVIVPLDADQSVAGLLVLGAEPVSPAVAVLPQLSLLPVAPRPAASPWRSLCSSLRSPSS